MIIDATVTTRPRRSRTCLGKARREGPEEGEDQPKGRINDPRR